jgi:Family of unknown function (DUF5946)
VTTLIPCIGCGALVPDIDGPTHRYIGASPGCWQAYGELLARGYGTSDAPAYSTMSRLTVDIYAAQHPGVPGKQSSQSVAAHLFILCLVLERNLNPAFATQAITRFLDHNKARGFPWLEPPASLGFTTVLDVLAATTADDYDQSVKRWAKSVWRAWQPYHTQIHAWVDTEASGE